MPRPHSRVRLPRARFPRARFSRARSPRARFACGTIVRVAAACVVVVAGAAGALAQPYVAKSGLNGAAIGPGDSFGLATAVGGTRGIVGAPFHRVGGLSLGAAYIYRESGSRWELESGLLPPNGTDSQRFGAAVAIDGVYAAIGAPRYSETILNGGTVHIFLRNLATWQPFDQVEASDVQDGDVFGAAVDLEGTTLVVGAPREDDGGLEAGAVYVFERVGSGFEQTQKIFNPDVATLADDEFGTSVSLSGNLLAVGSPRADPSLRGKVHVFRRTGPSAPFALEDSIAPPDLRERAFFGSSVSIFGDLLVAGAPIGDDGGDLDVGTAYLYRRQLGVWAQVDKLVHGGSSGDRFGRTVAIGEDVLAVGTREPGDDGTSGAVYAYGRVGAFELTEPSRVTAIDIGASQDFGASVGASGSGFFVGAPLDDASGSNSGAAWHLEVRDCREGGVDRGAGAAADVLFVNGSAGDFERIVVADASGPIEFSIANAPAGGPGKYFVHANPGEPTIETLAPLPAKLGSACFEVLLNGGAMPIAVFNTIGKEQKVGENTYFDGNPFPEPERAPAVYLDLPVGDVANLPPGTVITLQGAIIDPNTISNKGASLTNAVIVSLL